MDLEVVAMTLPGEEAKWLKKLFMDITIWAEPVPSIPLHSDSKFEIDRVHDKTVQ